MSLYSVMNWRTW